MSASKTTEKEQALPFGMIDSKKFSKMSCPIRWLVDGVLVENQPAVIGGPMKCLKTSVAIDLAVSISSGQPFPGEFEVPRPYSVAVFSGESGKATIQETARRVCEAKGTSIEDCPIFWSFRLPTLSRRRDLKAISTTVRDWEIKVVIIDPLYLCLMQAGMGASASNLYEVGAILSATARACLSAGATPVLIHHATKTSSTKGDAGLSSLAFAGIREFARQWLLLSRRTEYKEGSGFHALKMSVGGSAGHSGRWHLDVQEGVATPGEERKWELSVTHARHPKDDMDQDDRPSRRRQRR